MEQDTATEILKVPKQFQGQAHEELSIESPQHTAQKGHCIESKGPSDSPGSSANLPCDLGQVPSHPWTCWVSVLHEVKELNELAALPRAFPTVTVCVSVQSAPWVSTQSVPGHLRQRGIRGKTNHRQELLSVLSEQFVLEREREFARGGVPLSRCCHLHSQRLTGDTSQGGSTAHHSPSPAIPKCPQRPPSGHREKGSAGASLRLTGPHTLLAADRRALSPLPLPLLTP